MRLDDTQAAWNWLYTPEQMAGFMDSITQDMAWLEIEPDVWSSQFELAPRLYKLAGVLNYTIPDSTFGDYNGCDVVGSKHHYYPPDERLTAEHVLMDYIEGVNWCIRGEDLLTEDCSYDIFRKKLGLPMVARSYIPRLDFEKDEISKTAGKFKLKDFREAGIDPKDLIENLAMDCLNLHAQEWRVDNIKPPPLLLGQWAERMLK